MALTDIHTPTEVATTTIAMPAGPPPSLDLTKGDLTDQPDNPAASGEVASGEVVELSVEPGDARSDAELVAAAHDGTVDAFEALFDRWFERSWNVARTVVRHDETAAEIAQDAMLKAWQRLGELENPDAFGSWLLTVTRNRALDRIRRDNRSPVIDDETVSDLRNRQARVGRQDWLAHGEPSVTEVVEAHHQQELVWAASAALGDRDSTLLDLHLRHGLAAGEVASSLGVSVNNAHQQLFRLRRRLGSAIGAYVLWRAGAPLCDDLDQLLPINDRGVRYFDRSVSKLVSKHADGCDRCAASRAATLDPAALFASTPLLAVPPQLQQAVAGSLAEQGLPISIDPLPPVDAGGSAGAEASAGSGETFSQIPGDEILLTRVIDGSEALPPSPVEAQASQDAQARAWLEGGDSNLVDVPIERPEWNPGPILSSAETVPPHTSSNVIEEATETGSFRSWMASPPAMAGVAVGVLLTVMAVALAAGPELTGTNASSGDFGFGVAAGETSDGIRTGTTGLRSVADPNAADEAEVELDAAAVGLQTEDGDSTKVSSSYGAAVVVGDSADDDTTLVARSAAGASAVTTDAATGLTALRELEDLVVEETVAAGEDINTTASASAVIAGDSSANDVTGSDDVDSNRVSDGQSSSETASGSIGSTSSSTPIIVNSGPDGGAGLPPASAPTTVTPVSTPSASIPPTVGVSSNDSSDDDDDERDNRQPPSTSGSNQPPVTEARPTEPPTTQTPSTEPRPTEPPTTQTPNTEPQPTEPPTTQTPSTQPRPTEPPTTQPRPTEPPSTQPPTTDRPVDVDDDVEVDDDYEVDDDDEVDDEPEEDDDEVEDDDDSAESPNTGGTTSDTRPERDTNPSDDRDTSPSGTRPTNESGSGSGSGSGIWRWQRRSRTAVAN